MVVGINHYRAPEISDLHGAVADARRMARLLSGPGGYGFPEKNVCLLLDHEASTARFVEVFHKALIARARPGDTVVVYFSGHGSQVKDLNGDEPDELDETLVLADARTGQVNDLSDDQLFQMLQRLYAKTHDVTLILDACHSGSASRDGTVRVRSIPPAQRNRTQPALADESQTRSAQGDGGGGWEAAELSELLVLSAAGDGTKALEKPYVVGTDRAGGVFTAALVQTLAEAPRTWTWTQVAARVRQAVAAESFQIPYFQGPVGRRVFSQEARSPGQLWTVEKVRGPEVLFSGLFTPAWSPGAVVEVYPSTSATSSEGPDGESPNGILVQLTHVTAAHATGQVLPGGQADRIQVGAPARLLHPGPPERALRVHMRSSREPGGVPAARADAIRTLLESESELRGAVRWVDRDADLELMKSVGGRLMLVEPGTALSVRMLYSADIREEAKQVVRNLWQLSRRRMLLKLEGNPQGLFTNNETLQVRLVPHPNQPTCAGRPWQPTVPNVRQRIPLCTRYQLEVTLSPSAPEPLLVGGLVLFNDGGLHGFPASGRLERLEPGSHIVIADRLRALPPLGSEDDVMVFGTQEGDQVPWYLFSDPAATRALAQDGQISSLTQQVARFLKGDREGGAELGALEEGRAWTSTHLVVQVEAPPRLDIPPPGGLATREYGIPRFDIRPYLPDDPKSGLSRLLTQAHTLANAYPDRSGIHYASHDWSAPTDAENLKRGISSARAIWFAFTRAGLPFNLKDLSLSSAAMVSKESILKESFDRCDEELLRIGDVLVYRNERRSTGQVMLVIDPKEGIAWGSFGWEDHGRNQEGEGSGISAPGVGYQKIKYSSDGASWDPLGVKRVACWRHRQLALEWANPSGQPGLHALEGACDANGCEGE